MNPELEQILKGLRAVYKQGQETQAMIKAFTERVFPPEVDKVIADFGGKVVEEDSKIKQLMKQGIESAKKDL